MKEIEVAIACTDHTWYTTLITIPKNVHPGNAEEYAEGHALKLASRGKRSVAFVNAIWESPEEEMEEEEE